MKMAVIGAGQMGQAALYDLDRISDIDQLAVFDIDTERAIDVSRRFSSGRAIAQKLDAGDENAAAAALRGYDSAVACTTYQHNPGLTRAAIKAGCHLVDLGGNNDVVRAQLNMTAEAEKAGVVVIPDCGLAPGMVSLMVADGFERLDKVKSARIRVGGLPQVPRPPLNYQIVFSVEGLINEYWEPCVILEDGRRKTVNPMTAIEQLHFDGIGELEAFYTSGGTSTLPETYEGRIEFLDYKTIRYPGHCQIFRAMLELGLGSRKAIDVDGRQVEPRAVFREVLRRALSFNDLDMVLVRVQIEGEKAGQAKSLTYEIIDRQDSKTGLTAMMRCTAFPAAIIAHMAASGQIAARGVKPQEVVVKPSVFFAQLKKRGIDMALRES
ncbi:MAG: saccharopine dehydrogenase C-terminal domain-containing protein [Candidatus Zixiibacteriota bacterium]